MTDPLLHILQIKTIQNNMDGMTRYKVTMFDGETQHTCEYTHMPRNPISKCDAFIYSFWFSIRFDHQVGILATQKNELVESGELRIGSVIKLMEYAANVLSKDPPK